MGLGYIGLPTATLLASTGLSVVGIDVRQHVVETVNSGGVHFVEPDLERLVRDVVASGRLEASLSPRPADTFILAVPTPVTPGLAPDLSYVDAATRAIIPVLAEGDLVILESTSPPGTTERVAELVREARPALFESATPPLFAHCPERVLPGRILVELVENDRIVGGLDEAATEAAAAFYRRFVTGQVIETNARTAEMAKLVENSFRDVNIAFANELSVLAHDMDIDVWELIRIANHHPRVDILQPGPGVGGHCIAVDPWFLVAAAPDRTPLIRAAREVNNAKPEWVIQQVRQALRARPDAVVGCLGLTYKADVDDLRESPSLHIAAALHRELGERSLACDPLVSSVEYPPLTDLDTLLDRADIIVGLVPHREFRGIAPSRLEGRVVIDTCGMFR